MTQDSVIIEVAKGHPEREGFVLVGSVGGKVRLCSSLRRGGDTDMLLTISECRNLIEALQDRIDRVSEVNA